MRVVRKLELSEMAELLGVSETTVKRDLAAVRARGRSLLRKAQEAQVAVLDAGLEACAEFDAATRQAWADSPAAAKQERGTFSGRDYQCRSCLAGISATWSCRSSASRSV